MFKIKTIIILLSIVLFGCDILEKEDNEVIEIGIYDVIPKNAIKIEYFEFQANILTIKTKNACGTQTTSSSYEIEGNNLKTSRLEILFENGMSMPDTCIDLGDTPIYLYGEPYKFQIKENEKGIITYIPQVGDPYF